VSTYFGRRSDLLRLTAMQRSYRFSNSAARISTTLLLPLATIFLFSFPLLAQPGDEGQYLNRATEKLKRLDAQNQRRRTTRISTLSGVRSILIGFPITATRSSIGEPYTRSIRAQRL